MCGRVHRKRCVCVWHAREAAAVCTPLAACPPEHTPPRPALLPTCACDASVCARMAALPSSAAAATAARLLSSSWRCRRCSSAAVSACCRVSSAFSWRGGGGKGARARA